MCLGVQCASASGPTQQRLNYRRQRRGSRNAWGNSGRARSRERREFLLGDPPADFQLDWYITPMQTLERFVQLPENRSAHQAVVQVGSTAEVPFLFLHGPPGSGKSHLVRTLVENVTQIDPTKTAQVLPAAEIGRALIQ